MHCGSRFCGRDGDSFGFQSGLVGIDFRLGLGKEVQLVWRWVSPTGENLSLVAQKLRKRFRLGIHILALPDRLKFPGEDILRGNPNRKPWSVVVDRDVFGTEELDIPDEGTVETPVRTEKDCVRHVAFAALRPQIPADQRLVRVNCDSQHPDAVALGPQVLHLLHAIVSVLHRAVFDDGKLALTRSTFDLVRDQ